MDKIKVWLKKWKDRIAVITIVTLVGLLFFQHYRFGWLSTAVDSLKELITNQTKTLVRQDSLLKEQDKALKIFSIKLQDCQDESQRNNIEKSKLQNELRFYDDECEHEKEALLFKSNINNLGNNDRYKLLAELGQSKDLNAAELLLRERNTGLFKVDSGGDRIQEQITNGEKKNKSP